MDNISSFLLSLMVLNNFKKKDFILQGKKGGKSRLKDKNNYSNKNSEKKSNEGM